MPLFPRAAARPPVLIDEWSAESNLDLLRAIAVLCVVVRHLATVLRIGPRGWYQPQALGIFGVIIFFVHTSLVLMISLDRQWRKEGASAARLYASFLVRRFFRIYPLSITVVLLVTFLIVPRGDPLGVGIATDVPPGDLVANLLLVQDLALRSSVEGPLWSLPAEVQMYLLLPALFFVVHRRGARAIAFVVWPIAVLVAVACWKLDTRFNVGRYAPCFVAGVLCYGLLSSSRRLPFALFPVTVVASLLAYMAAYGRVGKQAGLGILVTIVLACLIPRFSRMRSDRLRRASHAVAKYSYGIYLFHVPCMWFGFDKARALGLVGSSILTLLLIAATSMLGYRYIEAPLIRFGQSVAGRILERPQPALAPSIAGGPTGSASSPGGTPWS